jgi:hypothetical protein
MKLLEARFHPQSKGKSDQVTVAKVKCEGDKAFLEPVSFPQSAIAPFDPAALLSRLSMLVASTTPRPYEELTEMKSEFWSFIEVPQDAT